MFAHTTDRIQYYPSRSGKSKRLDLATPKWVKNHVFSSILPSLLSLIPVTNTLTHMGAKYQQVLAPEMHCIVLEPNSIQTNYHHRHHHWRDVYCTTYQLHRSVIMMLNWCKLALKFHLFPIFHSMLFFFFFFFFLYLRFRFLVLLRVFIYNCFATYLYVKTLNDLSRCRAWSYDTIAKHITSWAYLSIKSENIIT